MMINYCNERWQNRSPTPPPPPWVNDLELGFRELGLRVMRLSLEKGNTQAEVPDGGKYVQAENERAKVW